MTTIKILFAFVSALSLSACAASSIGGVIRTPGFLRAEPGETVSTSPASPEEGRETDGETIVTFSNETMPQADGVPSGPRDCGYGEVPHPTIHEVDGAPACWYFLSKLDPEVKDHMASLPDDQYQNAADQDAAYPSWPDAVIASLRLGLPIEDIEEVCEQRTPCLGPPILPENWRERYPAEDRGSL